MSPICTALEQIRLHTQIHIHSMCVYMNQFNLIPIYIPATCGPADFWLSQHFARWQLIRELEKFEYSCECSECHLSPGNLCRVNCDYNCEFRPNSYNVNALSAKECNCFLRQYLNIFVDGAGTFTIITNLKNFITLQKNLLRLPFYIFNNYTCLKLSYIFKNILFQREMHFVNLFAFHFANVGNKFE